MTPRETALSYIERGWDPVAIPYRKKGPKGEGWHKRLITAETAHRYFNGELQNIGVKLGLNSGGLVDVDLDCIQALRVANAVLPPTATVFGRASKPRSHRIYYVGAVDGETGEFRPERCPLVQYLDPTDKRMLVELRGDPKDVDKTALQTVFPGSTHEDGEAIEWDEDDGPAVVRLDELRRRTGYLAAFALLGKHWPAGPRRDPDGASVSGGRHNANLVVAGWLTRSGWSEKQVARFLELVTVAAGGDADKAKREAIAKDSAARLKESNLLRGWTAAVEMFGERVMERAAEWLGVTVDRRNAALDDTELDTSQDGLALEMGREWADARHVDLWGQWFLYNGSRWERDERLLHMTRARAFLRGKAGELLQRQGDPKREARQLRDARTVASVVSLARSNAGQAASVDQWDNDLLLLGHSRRDGRPADGRAAAGPPGRLHHQADQRSRRPRRARRADLGCVPRAHLPPRPRADPVHAAGARVRAHRAARPSTSLVFAWGQGGNGKGVFFNTLADCSATTPPWRRPTCCSTRKSDRHPTDMAMLRGARLVIARSWRRGRAWDEPSSRA